MSVVHTQRAAILARAILGAVEPQQLPTASWRHAGEGRGARDGARDGAEERSTVSPAVARLLTPPDWQWKAANTLRGDPKYALWRLAAGHERPTAHDIRRAAQQAVAVAGTRSRQRAQAALAIIEAGPVQQYEAIREALAREREEAADAQSNAEMARRLPGLLRHATTVLDSAQAVTRQQYAAEEEACGNTLASEWFVTVHTAAGRAAPTGTMTEDVVREVYTGMARQEEDHVHELVTLFYPVTQEAITAWTQQRYAVDRRQVAAQPVRNMQAAAEYIRRQSVQTTYTEYNSGVFSVNGQRQQWAQTQTQAQTQTRTQAQAQAQVQTQVQSRQVPVNKRVALTADGVRTHPGIGMSTEQQERAEAEHREAMAHRAITQTYAFAGRAQIESTARTARAGSTARAGRANYAPYALVGRGQRMPAAGYALERALERLPDSSPLFFSERGEDAVAVEADRNTALAASAHLLPEMATLFVDREGSYVGDGVSPSGSTHRAKRTLQEMADAAAALIRGTPPHEVGMDTVGGTTPQEIETALSAVYMAREGAAQVRRRERASRVQVNVQRAPLYLRERLETPALASGRRTAHITQTYANTFTLLFDADGTQEREAVAVFGHAGVFRMTGSTALLYEGQPALVFDSIQATRHARNSARLGARVRIFRGTREEHDRALATHSVNETAVSISAYPV